MDILSNLNLNSNQVQNMVLHPSGTAPTAKTGAIYFDTTSDVHAVKVYGTVGGSSGWRTLLDGRNGSVTLAMLNCVLKDSDTSYLNSFAAGENTLIPTTGAVYGFFKDAIKKNDAMVYMGTFAAQATSGVTLTKDMFTLTGGTSHPDNLTTWMSKGYTFKVTGNGYFGDKKVEAGDVILVGQDSPGTTVANYDLIQMNLQDYVTTFGGVTGAIAVRGVGNDNPASTSVGAVNFSLNNGVLAGTVVRDTPVLTWEEATSNAPTLKVKAMGNTSAAMTVPAAGETRSGVMTTGEQTFAGEKTFLSMVTLKRPFEGQNYDILAANHRNGMLYFRAANVEIASNIVSTAWHFYPVGYRNDGTADVTTMYPMQIAGLSGTSAPTGGLFFTGDKTYCGADNSFFWGVNTRNPQYRLHVSGSFGAGDSTFSGNVTIGAGKKIYFGTSGHYIEYDSVNNAIHTDVGFYADSFVNSGGLGLNGSGSGGTGMAHVWKYSDLSGANEFDQESEEDTFNAYAIKQMWLEASGALNNTITSLTISGSGDVITNITKSGRTITATKGDVTLLGIKSMSTANALTSKEGLEVYRTISSTAELPSSVSNKSGSVIEWCRYVEPSTTLVSSKRNGAAQLYVPHVANRLFFRNSWGVGSDDTHSENQVEWNPWLEVVTAGEGGSLNSLMSASLIHSCTVKRSSPVGGTWSATSGTNAYKVFTTSYIFSTADLVSALYDSDGNQVMTDVTVVAYSGSDTTLAGKYAVRLTFAQAVGSSTTYKLVIYGV